MRRTRGLLVVGLLATVAVLASLGAPTGAALAAMPGEAPDTVRVALGGANATWHAVAGAPTIDDAPLPDTEEPVPEDRIEPWRGYERTIAVRLGGNGSLLVTAGGQGLVLEAPGGDEGAQAPGPSAETRSSGARGDRGSQAGSDPKAEPSEQEDGAGTAGDEAPRSGSGGVLGWSDADREDAEATETGNEGRLVYRPGPAVLLVATLVVAGAVPAWRLVQRLRGTGSGAEREGPGSRARAGASRQARASRPVDPGRWGSRRRRARPHGSGRDPGVGSGASSRGARARPEGPSAGRTGTREPRRKP